MARVGPDRQRVVRDDDGSLHVFADLTGLVLHTDRPDSDVVYIDLAHLGTLATGQQVTVYPQWAQSVPAKPTRLTVPAGEPVTPLVVRSWVSWAPHPDPVVPDVDPYGEVEPVRPRRWSVAWRWYDGWVGYYWDRRQRVLYVCPVPWLVFRWQA